MPPRTGARASSKAARGRSFRDVTPAPLVFLLGSDEYQAARSFGSVREQMRATTADVEVTRFDAANYQVGELLLSSSPSLFGGPSLIEFHGLERMNEDTQKDLTAYVANPDPDVVVVAHHGGGTRGKGLMDALKAKALVIDCAPLKKDAEKVEFVQAEFSAAKRKVAPDAARELVSAVGSDLAELGSACRQLIEDTEGQVDSAAVQKYFGGRVEATGFAVADAAVAGRGAQAVSLLRHALATGVDPVPLVSALAIKVRQAALVSGARESGGSLASRLKMAPWQVQQAQDVARRFAPEDLAACVRLLAETDAMVKGASRDPRYAVERAVVTIARAAGRR